MHPDEIKYPLTVTFERTTPGHAETHVIRDAEGKLIAEVYQGNGHTALAAAMARAMELLNVVALANKHGMLSTCVDEETLPTIAEELVAELRGEDR